MNAKSSGILKSDLESLRNHVSKGHFAVVKECEEFFLKPLVQNNNSGSVMNSLKAGCWFWLTEIRKAVKTNDVKILQLGYNQFMGLFVLMENASELYLEDVEEKEESVVNKKTNENVVRQDNNEERNISSSRTNDMSYNLSDDFFTEEVCQQIDVAVKQRSMVNQHQKVTPEKQDILTSSILHSDYLQDAIKKMVDETMKKMMDEKINLLMAERMKGELHQHLLVAENMKGDVPEGNPQEGNPQEAARKNPYASKSPSKEHAARTTRNPYAKNNRKRSVEKYHSQMVGPIAVHDMQLRNAKRQQK